jgi:hypothetical protein
MTHTNINLEELEVFLNSLKLGSSGAIKATAIERKQLVIYVSMAHGYKPNLDGCPQCLMDNIVLMEKWLSAHKKIQETETNTKNAKNKTKSDKAKSEQSEPQNTAM